MKKGRIEINKELCKGCDYCVKFCPKSLIEKDLGQNKSGFYPVVFRDCDLNRKCNGCKICAIVCPEAAIEIFIIEEENPEFGEGVV